MTSFVEQENERRLKTRSDLVIPAELFLESGAVSIYVMDLRPGGGRAVINAIALPERLELKLDLPGSGEVRISARIMSKRELAPKRWTVTFEQFEFADPADERKLTAFLNEITVESEDLGVKALRSLGSEELRRLSRFVKASRTLNPCQDYISAVEQVVSVMRRSLSAERGLFIVERGPDQFAVDVVQGTPAASQRGLRFSQTAVRQVAETEKPLLSLDTQTDSNLGEVQSIKMMGTVSIMVVPLTSRDRRFGFLYLDNSMSKGMFRESDLALATIIADLAASSMEKNWTHITAVQSERVAANRDLVSSITRDFVPTLNALSNLVGANSGESDPVRMQTQECLQLLESLLPPAYPARRKDGNADLLEIIEELTLDFEGLDIPLPPEEGWPPLDIDLDQLSKILYSLVKASKTEPLDPVSLNVSVQKKLMRITLESLNLQPSSLSLKRIFHPFRGLGLNEAQRLVDDQGGLLRVHRAPDQGTVFTVEFILS